MLDSSDIAVLGIFASSALFVSNIVFVALWIRARERALRAGGQPLGATRPDLNAVEDTSRQERLEVAMDAIAIEVERIAEGQRFVTKLLSDRSGPTPAERPAGRVITPH